MLAFDAEVYIIESPWCRGEDLPSPVLGYGAIHREEE